MQRIAMVFLLMPALALAFPPTDSRLLSTKEFVEEVCGSDDEIAQGVCLGFVAGATNFMQRYCVPEGIGIEDLRDLVVAEVSIGFNTGEAPEFAGQAVVDAIMRRWPCDE